MLLYLLLHLVLHHHHLRDTRGPSILLVTLKDNSSTDSLPTFPHRFICSQHSTWVGRLCHLSFSVKSVFLAFSWPFLGPVVWHSWQCGLNRRLVFVPNRVPNSTIINSNRSSSNVSIKRDNILVTNRFGQYCWKREFLTLFIPTRDVCDCLVDKVFSR